MKISCLQPYQQPIVEMLELDSTGICAGSGKNSFNPSHFDDTEEEW